MKQHLSVFLKGMLMGVCDLVPGISGGTIAFITGIYERLMKAVKAFSPLLVKNGFTWLIHRDKSSFVPLKKNFQELDLGFLIPLFGGIGASLLLGSRAVLYLLDNYYAYVLLFFIGLILASAKLLYDSIENHQTSNVVFGLLGLTIGVALAFLPQSQATPSPLLLFLSGFFGVSALFLPGISGAFILLVMGSYEYLVSILHEFYLHLGDIAIFGVGAVLGAMAVSRLVIFLFRVNKCRTLYVLLGLVIGCLAVPIRNVNAAIISPSPLEVSTLLVCFLFGMLIVWAVQAIEKKTRHKSTQ